MKQEVRKKLELKNNEEFLCCCQPHIEHNECLKFKLMFSDPNEDGNFSIYNRQNVKFYGNLRDRTPYDVGHAKFSG